MKLHKVVQWNCKSIKQRHEDLKDLIRSEDPDCICLQETRLKGNTHTIRGFTIHTHTPTDCDRAGGGVLVAIKNNINHRRISLQTTLQVVAIELIASNVKAVASIYLPPQKQIKKEEITDIVSQLPEPFMLLGDYNGHHRLWYSNKEDNRGKTIKDVITESNLICLNDQRPTYFRVHDQVTTNIDLSIVSSNICLDYTWNVLPYLYGSDHYPIILENPDKQFIERAQRWNLDQANWTMYKKNSETQLKPQDFESIDEAYTHLTDKIIKAANISIPKKKPANNRPPVPWWNKDCTREKRNTRSAFRRMKNNPTTENIITYKRRNSIKQRIYRNARRDSWKEYISKLTSRTPTKTVWEKIRKINGKYYPKPLPAIHNNGHLIKDPIEVANLLASYYSNISKPKFTINAKYRKK